MQKSLGIDLGSSSVIVSKPVEGIVSKEATVIAIKRADNSLLAIGNEAEKLFSRNKSGEVRIVKPLKESIITKEYTQRLISVGMRSQTEQGDFTRVLISVPCCLSEVEEGALREVATQAGAGETYLVYSPIAALVGSGVPLDRSSLTVNIGAARTDILLVCRGRIFHKSTLDVAGDDFDLSIATYINSKYGVKISLRTAEAIKMSIGTVWLSSDRKYIDVKGRDARTREIRTVRISSDEMFTALEEPTSAIVGAICNAITKIPSDCVNDVFDRGILLCGGGSALDGLDKMISGVTEVRTKILANPMEVVANGLARILSGLPEKMPKGTINISREYLKIATTKGRV